MKIDPVTSIVYSELVLSLYPLLIKGVSTNLFTQILARFGVFSVLALMLGSSYDFTSIWGKSASQYHEYGTHFRKLFVI